MRKLLYIFGLLAILPVSAQQLNCSVTVNADVVGATNNQIFRTLETALNDFVNRTDFIGSNYGNQEKISCSMFINVTSYDAGSGRFGASIQVQSGRPVYNSSYSTPVFNFSDKDFGFDYLEFQPLNFSPVSYENNLTSVISFYSLLIIGLDAETFTPRGGQPYFDVAQSIAVAAQPSNFKGWNQADGMQNRYFLINDLLSSTFSPYREALYIYHFNGMDKMADDLRAGKEGVKTAVEKLYEIQSVRPNAFLTRLFFDAKSDELASIFSGGPNLPIADLVDKLNRLSPLNSSKWASIKM